MDEWSAIVFKAKSDMGQKHDNRRTDYYYLSTGGSLEICAWFEVYGERGEEMQLKKKRGYTF